MVCSGKVFISIPINYYRFTNQYFDVMLCTIKLNFKIYFNFRCSNSWLLWMNFISVLYCDIIVMGLILLCYLSLWWFILNEYVRISSEMFFLFLILHIPSYQYTPTSYYNLVSCAEFLYFGILPEWLDGTPMVILDILNFSDIPYFLVHSTIPSQYTWETFHFVSVPYLCNSTGFLILLFYLTQDYIKFILPRWEGHSPHCCPDSILSKLIVSSSSVISLT